MLLNSTGKISLETNVNILGAKINEITTITISWLRYEFIHYTSNSFILIYLY